MSIGLYLLLSVAPPQGEAVAPTPGPDASAAGPESVAAPSAAPAPAPAAPAPQAAEPSAPAPTIIITPSAAPLEPTPQTTEAAPPAEASPTADDSVDYSVSWQDDPPSSIVITNVIHEPPRPAIRPQPEYHPDRQAYERDEPEEPDVHGFVGLSLRGTTTNHNPSAMVGGRVGFTFNDRFTIGGAFYSLTARYAGAIVDPTGRELGMRMAYGGLLLGWTLYKGRVVDVGLETVAAGGAACISRSTRSYGRWSCIEKVGLVSIEPALQIGFTVTDWVRLGVSGGYRFVTREAWREPNDFTLSGPFVGLDIAFGGFRRGKGS